MTVRIAAESLVPRVNLREAFLQAGIAADLHSTRTARAPRAFHILTEAYPAFSK